MHNARGISRNLAILKSSILLSLVLAAGFTRLARAEDLLDPTKMGPYPVGVTSIEFVDHDRIDSLTNEPRTLLTEIWYPATDDSKDLPRNKFSDFLVRGTNPELNKLVEKFLKVKLDDVDKRFKDDSVRDARIRDGKFPLIVFSHGNGGIRTQNANWCEHMVSHGYIIMSPDHTGNCAATCVNGKVIPYNVGKMMVASQDRPKDVSFLIDCMTRMNAGADSRFVGKIDLDRIGVAGHSFGGYTSAAIIETDQRVKAIIPMAPVWPMRKNFTTPVLMYIATEDKTIKPAGNAIVRRRYDESKGPRYSVEVLDGGHFTFTDMFQADPNFGDGVGSGERVTRPGEKLTYLPEGISHEILNSYSLAFFGVYLKGQDGYKKFLAENHYGDKIIYKFSEPGASAPTVGQ